MEKKNYKGFQAVCASLVVQLTIGIAYIWSVFQEGIASQLFSGDSAKASLSFSLLLLFLSLGSLCGGKFVLKYSTKSVVFIGGILIAVGFISSSFIPEGMGYAFWITYSLIGGFGMGTTYSTTIALAQNWFPHKKGLVTGIIVSALGFGGVVFTPIVNILIASYGEMMTIRILGVIFITVCCIGSLFMTDPPKAKKVASVLTEKPANEHTTLEMLKSPKFYIIAFSFGLACMGGLMMIGFASPIATAKDMGHFAAIGVMLISMFNSVGRLVWGIISDKIGRINTIMILLAGSIGCSLLVDMAQGYLLFVLIGLIGFFYGGFLSNFPTLTAEIFGAKHMATNYGVVLISFGIGAIVQSQIAGYYKDVAAAADNISLMTPAFWLAATGAGIALVLMFTLKRITKTTK